MADISKVTLPNNETYDLKDSVARGGIGNAKLFYGTCSSAAATTEKAVTCSEFTANDLVAGTMINVKFDNTNSGAVASLTLNVNGTGAKSIKYIYNNKLNNIPAAGYLLANNMYTFRYDGTNWVVQLMYNTDNNTTTVQDVYVGYNYGISGTNGYKQYSILMNDEQGLPTSLTTTNGTGTKTKATNGFQLGEMYYYNGSVNVNAGEAGSSIFKYVSFDVDARYSFNCGSTLVAGKSLYLVGSIGDNGLFYLDDTWWTMSLPTSDDGKVYVLVGNVVSTTKVHLIPFHPCYVYKNGGVQLYSPNYITDNYVPTTRKINNKVLSSDITLTASDVGALPSSTSIPTATTTTPKMNGTAAVGSETKWAKGDHVHPSDTSKVNKSGDTMTGLLKLNPSQYTDSHTVGALDLQNSNIIGTNGIYFADSSDGAGEAINFYRDATHADSIHAYNGALYFTPNRELGTGGTPKRVIVDGSTFPEAYLSWGGRNFSASYGPIDAAMVDYLGANRFAFLKADGITVEYTRDNGETWIDYGLTDAQKAGLFSTIYACVVGKSSNTDANRANANCQLRVTIDTNLAKCYTVLNKFIFFVSTTGSGGSWASLDVATHGNPTTWVNKFNKVGIGGWSGYNVINTGEITTYGNSNSQYQYLRFTFGIETQSSSYAGLSVSKIMAYGGVGWTTASNMATHGHLYSFDSSQNATFPAKVTATEFSGVVNATTATGTLPIAHGGTGATTASAASNNLLSGLPDWTAVPTDDTKLVRRDTAGAASFGQVKFSTIWSYIKSKADALYQVIRSNSSYNLNSAKYVGNATPNKYARIKIPNISNVWTMLYMEVSIRGGHDNGYGGKVLINAYHNSTNPIWESFKSSVIGVLPNTITVYGSDGQYIYIKMPGATYQNFSVDKMLLGDAASNVNASAVEVDYVDSLPTTYQTAAMQFYAKEESVVSSTLAVASWSNGVYSFTSTYPNASYDIAVEPDGNSITTAQYEAWTNAKIVGNSASNTIKALGTVPTVAIPVVIRVMPK